MSIDVLQEKIRMLKNPTMVALDPVPALIPETLLAGAIDTHAYAAAYRTFCRGILDSLAGFVPAVKLQSACFAALGSAGIAVMQEILSYAREKGYYVVLDSMRADFPETAEIFAQSVFGAQDIAGTGPAPYPCDGVTVNGYVGSDSIQPFLPYCRRGEKSVFVLVKSPNRSAVEVQDLLSGGRLVHTAMADLVSRWGADTYGKSGYAQVAAVVSAAHPEGLRMLRKRYDRVFFLVPDTSAQGGTMRGAQYAFDPFGHGAVLYTSQPILAAWKKQPDLDYKAAARKAAEKMKRNIAAYCTVR